MANKPWWKYEIVGQAGEFELHWAETGIASKALEDGACMSYFHSSGTLKPGLEALKLLDEIREKTNTFIVKHKVPSGKSQLEEWMLVNDETGVNFDYHKADDQLSISIYSLNEESVLFIKDRSKTLFGRKVNKGKVFVVVSGDGGPYLHPMGTAGEDFIPENYRPEVVEDYRHVVDDLNSHSPCGRIVVLDGPPGSGKTHSVRALLNEVPKATFVLVPSNMMSGLGSPNFIKALLREKSNDHPIILIVEDADEALASRKADNLSEISALLNFSDGIFGALLDIRIIATTNVDIGDLDPAVLRDGRLCRRIEVGKLDHEQAEKIYKRLGGDKENLFAKNKFFTLAEIYRSARAGEQSTSTKKKPTKNGVGFQLNTTSSNTLDDLGVDEGDVVTSHTSYFRREGAQLVTLSRKEYELMNEFEEDDEDEPTDPDIFIDELLNSKDDDDEFEPDDE